MSLIQFTTTYAETTRHPAESTVWTGALSTRYCADETGMNDGECVWSYEVAPAPKRSESSNYPATPPNEPMKNVPERVRFKGEQFPAFKINSIICLRGTKNHLISPERKGITRYGKREFRLRKVQVQRR